VKAKIAVLPGDGIGPEIIAEAVRVLEAVAQRFGHEFSFQEALVGGAAIDATHSALPQETLDLCKSSDAVLLGAVGGPKWDDLTGAVRPEQGLLGLRKELGLFANLRPVKLYDTLLHSSPLREEVVRGTDLVVVRELTGGIYFGQPRGREVRDGVETAFDTDIYTVPEVERILRVAFDLARKRRNKVTSVDKSNVMASSQLWREVAIRMGEQNPDVELEHLFVDAAAMYLIKSPTWFDVMVTNNMFGDILSDEASMLAGSLGMLPSASLGAGKLGVYEPSHGSAPRHAGKDEANPIATILSGAFLLRHSLDLDAEARAIEDALSRVLDKGFRTYDIMSPGNQKVGTRKMGEFIAREVLEG